MVLYVGKASNVACGGMGAERWYDAMTPTYAEQTVAQAIKLYNNRFVVAPDNLNLDLLSYELYSVIVQASQLVLPCTSVMDHILKTVRRSL